MKIERFVVGIYETNTYIIYHQNTSQALIIDPGDELKRLTKYIDRNSLKLVGIILTHYHHDHIGVAQQLKVIYNCPILAHKKEVEGLKDPHINYSSQMRGKAISIIPDDLLSDGKIIDVGEGALEVIHTPGHTPGGICLKVVNANIIFTGDTVFDDDLGRTDLEGGSEEQLKRTVLNKVSKWPDSTIIYPGHGNSATIAEVRKRNVKYFK